LELYGLVSFIDDLAFGDLKSFRAQYARLDYDGNFDDLKRRIAPVCKRTLRRQVLEYIRYTERKAYTQEFIPTADEEALYDLVSEYLRRPNLQALPASQRALMTLVMRKLLASSTFAIAGALGALADKLERRLKDDQKRTRAEEEFDEDYEALDELVEEFEVEDESAPKPLSVDERDVLKHEISDLRGFHDLAMRISQNAKGESLLHALQIGFRMAGELGGAEKAVIFTESRRTQNYLVQLLSENGYADDIALFNGANTDPQSRMIYADWKARYQGTDKCTGSRSADTRAAIVDYFRERARILIATEAAAEGINLQFCSLVVNFDLPWNPQRIEQRIGRCHRYGQKHDVVVVNFLNKKNAADQRVYKILSEKFKLFSGVFGASDEVLGNIESGVDFEKRIVEIYQTCRTTDEIQSAFEALQAELGAEIDDTMRSTRQKLLENFDSEVAEKLSVYKAEATASLNRYEALLWDTTRHMLDGSTEFDDSALTFRLHHPPIPDVPTGVYTLKRRDAIGHHYRLQHPLAQHLLEQARMLAPAKAELVFDYSGAARNIAVLEPLVGQSGALTARRLTVQALETEDYILLAAHTDEGAELDAEQARRLFNLPASVVRVNDTPMDGAQAVYRRQRDKTLAEISARNAAYFEEEMDKLDHWADDKKKSLEIQIKDLDAEIKQHKAVARKLSGLEEKVALQRRIKNMESKRTDLRRSLFDAQDEIDKQKDGLLDEIEGRMRQSIEEEELFTIGWRLT
jgi:superfamily II DNA/RNA helicase